ncbi:MAG: hypothetical protein OXJ56_00590 [Rhodospirillaceae bacterium]|nr:hypothetical protein [Rhodospirillaceae bacterium]
MKDIFQGSLFNGIHRASRAGETFVFFEAPGCGFPRAPKARLERDRKPLRKPGGVVDPALSERGQPDRADEAAAPGNRPADQNRPGRPVLQAERPDQCGKSPGMRKNTVIRANNPIFLFIELASLIRKDEGCRSRATPPAKAGGVARLQAMGIIRFDSRVKQSGHQSPTTESSPG